MLAACGSFIQIASADPLPAENAGPRADYPMVIGAPFVVDGVTYVPADTMNYDAVGRTAVSETGGATISGAHRTLPLPSYVEVTSLDSGRTILVRLERRGPMAGKDLLELSPGAAAQLGISGQTSAPVRVRRVNPPEQERAMLRSGGAAAARMDTPKGLLAALNRRLEAQTQAQPQPVPKPVETLPLPAKPAEVVKPATKPSPKPTSKPDVKPAAQPVSTPAAKPLPKSAPVQTEGKGDFVVQVGAFSDKARAQAVAGRAGGAISPAGNVWRVRIGPFRTRAEAEAALAKAKGAGYSEARIQHAG